MNDDKKYFFDNPDNVKRVLQIFYVCCALLFVLDFVIHRHVMHSWETLWGFYPIYGFVGCVILVLIAKWMRIFLMRPEDYYDDEVELSQKPDSSQIHSSATGGNHVDD